MGRDGSARAREGAERRREHQGSGGRLSRQRRARDPRPLHRRGRRSGTEAERRALPGRQGDRWAGSRLVGRPACGRARAEGGGLRRREDADERMGGDAARALAEGARAGHRHRHGRLDEHVRRAHCTDGRRQGLLHVRARGRLLDDERRLAQRVDQLRTPERLDRDQLRCGDGSARRRPRRRVTAQRRVAVVCGQRSPSEPSVGIELSLERRERARECPSDPAREHDAVEDAPEPAPRLELDDESVDEAAVITLEVPLVSGVRKARLSARVRHQAVRLEFGDRHRQRPLTAENARDELRRVSSRAPARPGLEAHVSRPEAPPVRDVGDEGESLLHGRGVAVRGFDPHAHPPPACQRSW